MKHEIIMNCLSETLNKGISEIKKFNPDASLTELGMTSLLFITFIVKIEEACDIEVLDSDLIFENFETINKLFHTLSKYFDNSDPLKKVLILDADNVLWKGISGEEEIQIDEAVITFQKQLVALYHQGVLLCLCSKNDPEIIDQAFASDKMILKKEHFTVFIANRLDKASNLQRIVNELNLSPDSFVFADDSDYELGYIQLNFPEVTCVKVDYTAPEQFRNSLSDLFANVNATSNLNRTQLYREQKEREKEKHRFTSVHEYNASLETQITCQKANKKDCERLAELSARTHQFNLSNRSYSKDELLDLLTKPNYMVFTLSARDKYGDMGIVGMAVLNQTIIEAFMLSCRVFDRNMEFALLNEIKSSVRGRLEGIYCQTDKNKRFQTFYPDNEVTII